MHHAKQPQHAARSPHPNLHAQRVAQYAALLLMPEIAQRIDDIQHANYAVPVLMHGQRVLKPRDRDVALGSVYAYTEADYVDGREPQTYTEPDVEFNAELHAQQVATLEKLNEYLRCMLRAGVVSHSRLKTVLTAQQYSDYTNALTSEQHPSEIDYSEGMPSELKRYKKIVAKADFQYNKFERMSSQRSAGAGFRSTSIDRAYNTSDGSYERAIEHLESIWSAASAYEQRQLQLWMDRDIDFDAGYKRTIGIGPVLIPRVRGSKSHNALDSGLPKLSKRLKRKECQLIALRDAAMMLAFKPKPESENAWTPEQSQALRDRIAKMLKDRNLNNEWH